MLVDVVVFSDLINMKGCGAHNGSRDNDVEDDMGIRLTQTIRQTISSAQVAKQSKDSGHAWLRKLLRR